MHAKCVEELLVYQKALAASHAASAILTRPCFDKDRRLRDQISSSSERTVSVIPEGFSQSTDRHFASYLYRSRGSSSEIRTQFKVAVKRGYITQAEAKDLSDMYEEIAKMLTGLIAHLKREDRKDRP
jgi:four helix bundle protein